MKLTLPGRRTTAENDATQAEDARDESTGSRPRLVTFLQGATVFVVMFVTLWWLLSRAQRE